MKNKNTTLLRKLRAYSAMAGSIVAVAGTANAQAIYTDIEPDYTGIQGGAGYLIDLDNDGISDFGITLEQSENSSGGVTRKLNVLAYNGSVATYNLTDQNYPLVLSEGEMINANLDWQGAVAQTMANEQFSSGGSLSQVTGKWYGVTDKYLPLRFKIGVDIHYAWARFDVSEVLDSFTIKDYAYNSVANQGLTANQGDPTAVGISLMPESVKIFAYDGIINTLFINQDVDNANLIITNMMGQQVKSMIIRKSSTQFDVSDLPYGIYVVTVNNAGKSYSQKVIISK